MGTLIHGFVAPGFETLRNTFAANFEREDANRELGASFAAFRGEELIADLHAGYRDPGHATPWTADTLVNVWSTSKGIVAIEVAVLVDRGALEYGAPVVRYWPEYGQNGKSATTVSHVMSHQAGLPGFSEPTMIEDFYDWETVTARLARQAPMWKPGAKNAYHSLTYGFLVGELIRRVSGMSAGEFLAKEVAGPLRADVFIGLPEQQERRVSQLMPPLTRTPVDQQMPPEARASITNPDINASLPNSRAWRAAEIPAANGHASALGLARLYAVTANGGRFGGVNLMRPETIAALNTVQTNRVDLSLGIAPGWRNGVFGNVMGMFGPNPGTFGHPGWGGSFGCCDTENRIAIGYAPNQMGDRRVGDVRATLLCDALYACL